MPVGNNTAKTKQSRMCLECEEENFLTQTMRDNQGRQPVDLLFVNSNHEIMEYNSWRSEEGGRQNCHLGLEEGRLGLF